MDAAEAELLARKRESRRELRARRDALAASAEGAALARTLRHNLAAFLASAPALLAPRAPGAGGFRFACYFALGSEWDFDALAAPDWLYPRVAEQGELVWFPRGASADAHPPGRYGIREAPAELCAPCDASAERPWVAIVPALACDAEHVRLGYGGGFYDRFLARHGAHVFTVCCVPTALRSELLPRGPHDVPMDVVVDERGVHFRARPTEAPMSAHSLTLLTPG